MRKATYLVSAAVVAILVGSSAQAQVAENDGGIADIVVTAQKRAENMQDVPIAVAAVTSEAAAESGIRTTSDLSFAVAGLNVTRKTEATNFNLRGIGTQGGSTGQDSAIATFVDGVYMPSMAGATFALNNIERVEVLKGPQGTLYGRNATGGAVNVITKDPSFEPAMQGMIGFGNKETLEGALYVTSGLGDKVAMDLAAYYRDQGKGFGKNLILGTDVNKSSDVMFRGKILVQLGENTKAVLAGDYSRTRGSIGISYRPVPTSQLVIPADPANPAAGGFGYAQYAAMGGGFYDSISDFQPHVDTKMFGGYLRLEHEMGDVSLKSITAYRGSDGFQRVEVDATPAKIIDAPLFNSEKQWTEELQLAYSSDRLQALVGAFFMDARSSYDPFQIIGLAITGATGGAANGIRTESSQFTKSYAVFGQLTYAIGENTNLTLGARYTIDKRRLKASDALYLAAQFPLSSVTPKGHFMPTAAPFTVAVYPQRKDTFKEPTWRVALDHKLSEDVMLYASYSRGFKSGVFNLVTPTDPAALPEKLDAIEVGVKSDLMDRRLRVNVSGFYYKYKNIQAFQVNGVNTTLSNAASARIWGLDLDVQAALGAGFTLSGTASFLDHKYGSFPVATMSFLSQPAGAPGYAGYTPGFGNYVFPACGQAPHSGQFYCSATGNKLVNAPEVSFGLSLNHEIGLSGGSRINTNLSWAYNGGFYWAVDNRVKQKAFSLINAQVMWTSADDKYNFRIWGRNLGKEKYYASFDENGTGDIGVPAPGRTFGASVGFNF